MMYQSKKDDTVFAKLVSTDDKYKTSLLEYTTGDKAGKTINVTDATLKRWWKKTDEAVEETPADETLRVKVEDSETGKLVDVDIDPAGFIPGVDDVNTGYDFNNAEKKYIPMPQVVKEIYLLGEDPYPTVEELVDMMVSWGAEIKAYAEWIRMFDGTKIIFRRNRIRPGKSCIEVRMKENVQLKGFETEHSPLKSALLKTTPYVIKVKTISELEQVVKLLTTTTK